ncbi:AraC family transcriptional regulator N-terminal domain-containing protein [Rhizobium helianthi]|uniref:AraC family transcriptional regulator N-terminal domain-containing protein n=1 Tax=Rhizobium helianthi TaxID=1132695 RepID=A0ABW4M530_9HYPH
MDRLQELTEIIARHTEEDGIFATRIPRLSLVRMSKRTEPMPGVQQPALCLIAQGVKQVLLADEVFEYGPARHLIASADLPITGQVIQASPDEPYLSLKLDLDLNALSTMLIEMPPPRAGFGIAKSCGKALCLSRTDPQLLEAAVRLLRLLDTPEDIAFLAPLAEKELLYRLMRGDQAQKLQRMLMPESRLQQVNRAIAWIRQNYDKPFSVERVAQEARMSTSSLHEHFREVTAMSPLQYQKQLRLQEARRLIMSEALDAASAAHRVGYDSPSQFSREYRRLFGAPPIQDISRLKAEPGRYAPASA